MHTNTWILVQDKNGLAFFVCSLVSQLQAVWGLAVTDWLENVFVSVLLILRETFWAPQSELGLFFLCSEPPIVFHTRKVAKLVLFLMDDFSAQSTFSMSHAIFLLLFNSISSQKASGNLPFSVFLAIAIPGLTFLLVSLPSYIDWPFTPVSINLDWLV